MFPGFTREESFESKTVGGKAAGDKRGERGGRPGNHRHGNTCFAGAHDQAETGVGNGGHSRIADHENPSTGASQVNEVGAAFGFIMFVIGEHLGVHLDAEARGELVKTAGIFRGHGIGPRNFGAQTRRGIGVVSNGGGGKNNSRVLTCAHSAILPRAALRRGRLVIDRIRT